jgi:hypothetical protein
VRTELVGRQAELGELVGALDRAVSGAGGVVLVAGPAGIGKTRLCDELYGVARARGLAAGWTACWEAAPVLTLAPWLDLLGQLGSTIDPTPVSDDPAVARAMLFERVLSALRDLARREPLLLVIDDLQWAEPISVQLLGRVLGPLRGLPVLLLATVRTDLGGSVDDTQVRELARHCDMVALSPLDDDAIAAVATARIGAALSDRLRHELVTRAAGNPLFARELASLLSTADPAGRDAWVASATHGVPHALRSLLLRPLEGLSGASREVLAAVAIAGEHATVEVVASCVSGIDAQDVLRCLIEAERAGVVVRSGPASYGLHHPLLRSALIDQLDPVERSVLHQRVADALDERAGRGDADLLAVADHRLQAAAAGQAVQAMRSALDAAAFLVARAANDQAATLLERALAIARDDVTAEDRGEALLALGAARWAAGDPDAGRRALVDAATVARTLGRPDLLARVALALGGPGGFEVRLFDREQVHLLEDALRGLGSEGDDALRSWVSARLSVALSFAAPEQERTGLAEQAIELARASGDRAALAHALAAWCDVHAGPDHVGAREAVASEIVQLARQVRDPATELLGLRLRVVARLEAGDLVGADADIETFARVAAPLADPRFDWVTALWRAMRALYDDRVEDFLNWNDEVRVLGEQAGSAGAEVLAVGQRWLGLVGLGLTGDAIRLWEEHRPEERFAHLGPMMVATTALALAVAGDNKGADQLLDRFDLDDLPKDSEWLSSVSHAAEAMVRTGNGRLATRLREALEPYADLWVIDGIGGVIRGPVRRWIDELQALADGSGAARGRDAAANRFLPDGEVWTLAFDGEEVHVRDSKGMRDLATLLARPGQEVSARDLMAAGAGTVVQFDTGPVLDDVARAAYRDRVEALHQALDAADSAGDAERSAALQAELDYITDELRRSTGLGGRARRQGSTDQRARTAVTGRIRDAIKRIETVHPRLAEHLRASIRTGTVCAYEPIEPVDWEL